MTSRTNDAFVSKLAVQNAKKIDTIAGIISELNAMTFKSCTLNVSASVDESNTLSVESELSGIVPTPENCTVFFGLKTSDIPYGIPQNVAYAANEGFEVVLEKEAAESTSNPMVILNASWLANSESSEDIPSNQALTVSFCQAINPSFLESAPSQGNATVKFFFL